MKTTKITKRMEGILKRYAVTFRDGEQTVRHKTYGFETVVDPVAFAIYEAALKANHIAFQIYFRVTGRVQEAMQSHAWYSELCEANGFELPALEDDWGREEGARASEDFRYCQKQLMRLTGRDAQTGEERDLYYALLD